MHIFPAPRAGAALLAYLLLGGAAPAWSWQGGGLSNHSHSSVAGQGGSALSPATLTVSGSFHSNSAPVIVSSAALIVDGTGGSVSLPANSVNASAISGLSAQAGPSFTVGTSSFVVDASSVGIRTTAVSGAAFNVNGSAGFGSGATKSTFTATGELDIQASAVVKMGLVIRSASVACVDTTNVTSSQACSTNERVIGGGCNCTMPITGIGGCTLRLAYPDSNTSFTCAYSCSSGANGDGTLTKYAICARMDN